MVNYKRLIGPCRFLHPLTASLLTLNLSSTLLNLSGTPGVVLIILLAGGGQTRVYGLPWCRNLEL